MSHRLVHFINYPWYRRVLENDSGQDLIEYALMAAAIAVAVGAILPGELIPAISGVWQRITTALNAS